MATKTFTDLLNALGTRESGTDNLKQQYVAINQLHFVGKYQFGEALLQTLGYYQPGNYPIYDPAKVGGKDISATQQVDGPDKNYWLGTWAKKDGVTQLGLNLAAYKGPYPYYPTQNFQNTDFLGNPTAQENAIRQEFAANINTIYYELQSSGKTIDSFLNQSRTYNTTDGKSHTFKITLSGIVTGAHLVGVENEVNYLLNNQVSVDENGTSIAQYMDEFSGYKTTFSTKPKDTIVGTQYNDVLIGFGGHDTLTGGAGADRFRFYSLNDGGDTITDFNPKEGDKIEVPEKGFGQQLFFDDANTKSIQSFRFVVGSAATSPDTRFVYDDSTGSLFFDPDGSGAMKPTKLAVFTNKPILSASDIVIF